MTFRLNAVDCIYGMTYTKHTDIQTRFPFYTSSYVGLAQARPNYTWTKLQNSWSTASVSIVTLCILSTMQYQQADNRLTLSCLEVKGELIVTMMLQSLVPRPSAFRFRGGREFISIYAGSCTYPSLVPDDFSCEKWSGIETTATPPLPNHLHLWIQLYLFHKPPHIEDHEATISSTASLSPVTQERMSR